MIPDRWGRVQSVIEWCHKNGVSYRTPGLADKITTVVLHNFPGMSKKTVQSYVWSAVEALRVELASEAGNVP